MWRIQCVRTVNKTVNKTVNLHVVGHAPCVTGRSENKDISPNQAQIEIKCVKPVCCVNHCLYAPSVQNVPHVVENPPVGARLQRFWQVWHSLGANTRVVSILQEGYNLPFKEKPPLTRSSVIKRPLKRGRLLVSPLVFSQPPPHYRLP